MFAKAWEQEVGFQHLQVLAGNESTALLWPKSVVQLQDCHDFLQSLECNAHNVPESEDASHCTLFVQIAV